MKTLFVALVCALLAVSCTRGEKKLRVAATSVPHAQMLECIQPEMKKRGVPLEIVVVDDYNLPNRLLAEGEVDANFFQHLPFLESQRKPQLTVLAYIHYEPLGLYSSKWKSLTDLKEGARLSIPSDPANEARALLFLESLKLVILKNKGFSLATPREIAQNLRQLKFEEIDAPLLAHTLPDVDFAVIPANVALMSGLNPLVDALALEKSTEYQNVLVVRKGEEGREDLVLLASLLTSEKMREFLLSKYKGAVCPSF